MDVLNILGNVASIIGLGVTVWVLYRVRNIEKAFLKQAILPPTMRVLRRYLGNLERAIETKSRQATLQELERCRSLLNASHGYLDGHRRESCEQTVQVIENVCQLFSAEIEFWTGCDRAISRLYGVHEDLKTLVKEMEWRTKDAN